MTVTPCDSGCAVDPAIFHVVRSPSGSPYGVISFTATDCTTVQRTGDFLYGCPGDTAPAPDPSLEGTVGVYGTLPSSVRFATAQPIIVGTAPGVQLDVYSASSDVGIGAGIAQRETWNLAAQLGGPVGIGMSGVVVASLVVVLVVRFIRRARSV